MTKEKCHHTLTVVQGYVLQEDGVTYVGKHYKAVIEPEEDGYVIHYTKYGW